MKYIQPAKMELYASFCMFFLTLLYKSILLFFEQSDQLFLSAGKYICPNGQMHLSKFHSVFVTVCFICISGTDAQKHLVVLWAEWWMVIDEAGSALPQRTCNGEHSQHIISLVSSVFVKISKYICPDIKQYLSKYQKVFVLISKCICSNMKINSSKNQNVSFSKYLNIFVQMKKKRTYNGEHSLHNISLVSFVFVKISK